MSNINKTYVFETVLISGGTTGTTAEFITGATFNTNTGILDLETVSGNTISVPLDGRYSLTGHTHDISEITGFTDNSTNWDSAYDDTITGMTVTGTVSKTITLTQRDGDTITADFMDDSGGAGGSGDVVTGMTFFDGTGILELRTLSGSTIQENLDGRYLTSYIDTNDDDYVTGATFNIGNGVLEFTRLSGGTFNVDLDNRYALTGHTHTVSDITDFPTDLSAFTNDIGYLTAYTDTNIFVTGGTFNISNGELTFTNVSGGTFNVDLDDRYSLTGHAHPEYLTGYTDNNNYITGATFNSSSGDLTLTTISGDTIIENLDGRYLTGFTATINTDDYITGATFNLSNGELTLTRLSGSSITVDLDDRYSLTGHTHDISEITGFINNSTNWDTAYDDSITAMTVTGTVSKTITLEQRDGSTITANFTDNSGVGGSGDVVTGMTFSANTGILELRTLSGSTIQENLDGRYSLTGHTHNLSELNNDAGFITGATSTADDYVSGGTFNTSTGDLALTRLSGGTVTINLDDRYLLAGPVIFSAETSGATTYVGYGAIVACKIRKIDTISGGTYTAFWSEGVETLDKNWNNRYTYSYF